MKLPLDQRTAFANGILELIWPCSYWNREEQMFACAEGWILTLPTDTTPDRIRTWLAGDNSYTDFNTNQDAVQYVLRRAEEGSPLHCRALALHVASVLKYGQQS